jgi:hypothetical protein
MISGFGLYRNMQKWRQWETADEADWRLAVRREAVIGPLAEQEKLTKEQLEQAMLRLEIGRSLLYKLFERYKQRPQTSSLLPWKRGRDRNVHILDDSLWCAIARRGQRRAIHSRPRSPRAPISPSQHLRVLRHTASQSSGRLQHKLRQSKALCTMHMPPLSRRVRHPTQPSAIGNRPPPCQRLRASRSVRYGFSCTAMFTIW